MRVCVAANQQPTAAMRISVCLTIAIAIATLALLAQQAHAWAQTCADGNTDVCCHLERIGWAQYHHLRLQVINAQILGHSRVYNPSQCDPSTQQTFDDMVPLMCQTDCWGGAFGREGIWGTMPTHASVLGAGCTVKHFVDGTCPPQPPTPPTPAAPALSSSTATHNNNQGATSGRDDDDHPHISAAAASAPPLLMHAPIALAFAVLLWH